MIFQGLLDIIIICSSYALEFKDKWDIIGISKFLNPNYDVNVTSMTLTCVFSQGQMENKIKGKWRS